MDIPEWLATSTMPEGLAETLPSDLDRTFWGPFAVLDSASGNSYLGFLLVMEDDSASWTTAADQQHYVRLGKESTVAGDTVVLVSADGGSPIIIRPFTEGDAALVGIEPGTATVDDVIGNANDIARSVFLIPDPVRAMSAAASACPVPTQNVALNLANRQKAIDGAGYGPMNPQRPNEAFWQAKADRWSTTIEEASPRSAATVRHSSLPRL